MNLAKYLYQLAAVNSQLKDHVRGADYSRQGIKIIHSVLSSTKSSLEESNPQLSTSKQFANTLGQLTVGGISSIST